MEVLHDTGRPAWPGPGAASVVTVGAYDGVHLGHRAVIAEVRRRAAAAGLRSVVVTFDRHPAAVVRPESAPLLLTDLDQKLELLAGTGVDAALVIAFDHARAAEPAEDFVREVLVTTLAAAQVVVGADFHFGHGRRGDVAMLERLGADAGFVAVGLDLVDEHGTPVAGAGDPERDALRKVSSTSIRQALVAGEVLVANEMLGRPYELRGVVPETSGPPGVGSAGPAPGITPLSVPGEILVPAPGRYRGRVSVVPGDAGRDCVAVTIAVGAPRPRLVSHTSMVELDGVTAAPGTRMAVMFDGPA